MFQDVESAFLCLVGDLACPDESDQEAQRIMSIVVVMTIEYGR